MKIAEKYYALLPVALFCAAWLVVATYLPLHDFSNYYFGGKLLASGQFSLDIYFPYWFNKHISGSGHDGVFASFAPNTPFLAVVFYPFALLPPVTAKLVFNGISTVLLLWSLSRLAMHYKIRPAHLAVVPILFFVPIKNNLLFGQVYFLLFFLLAEGWLAYQKQKWLPMALFWGFAIVLKIFPVILVFPLIFKKQWKPLGMLAVTCISLVVFSVFITGAEVWAFCLESVLPKASSGEIATAFVDNYQSVLMLLKRIFVRDTVENPGSWFDYPQLFSVLVVIFKIKLLAVGYYVTKKTAEPILVISYWMLAMILLSPYGSTYTFVFLLFPFFALLEGGFAKIQKAAGLALLFVVANVPVSSLAGFAFPVSYSRLWALLVFFGIIVWRLSDAIDWKRIAIIAALPLLMLFADKEKTTASEPVLADGNAPILIYDYHLKNNRLTYSYWDEKGAQSKSIAMPAQSIRPADLNDGQVYYLGTLLTHDASHKKQPLVINGRTLVYLSDAGRGIGFFTLRKIDL